MAFIKRTTPEQRAKKIVTVKYRRALKHPLLKKLCYGVSGFDPTPMNIVNAIELTKKWKGATYQQKVVTLALDIVLEKAFGEGILEPGTYNRLQDHLESNDTKILAENFTVWQTWMWDIYHDYYGLYDINPGELELPKLTTPKRPKPKKKTIKRRKKK